ncbi:MAG: hypothetical protein RLZZ124_45 [Cyanobacteriota bacterium]|jgi:DNA-binding transcriptional LysR family regulator
MTTIAEPICRAAQLYRTPQLLQDIRLLDLLELSGTTVEAAELLNLSQPTVSRRYRKLAHDFGLERQPRRFQRCRYGSSEAIRLLRLGCRAHRLAAGVARIGADLMHQPLLDGLHGLLPTPVRFRPLEAWAELVREGVLDGALVSDLELQAARMPDLTGLQPVELGVLPLGLGVWSGCTAASPGMPMVLVPHRGQAPGLQSALQAQGLRLKRVGPVGTSLMDQWRRYAHTSGALPLYPPLHGEENRWDGVQLHRLPSERMVRLLMLMPGGHGQQEALQPMLNALRWHRAFRSPG